MRAGRGRGCRPWPCSRSLTESGARLRSSPRWTCGQAPASLHIEGDGDSEPDPAVPEQIDDGRSRDQHESQGRPGQLWWVSGQSGGWGCRAASGRGKPPVPPGQESENHGCIRGLRQSRGQMSSCPGPRSHATASLGTPCGARLPRCLGPPPEAQPCADPACLLAALARLRRPPSNVHADSPFSLKHTCKKTSRRHRKRRGRVTCGKQRYS